MIEYPMQTLLGGMLLLTLAFSVDEGSSAGTPDRAKAAFRTACENSVSLNTGLEGSEVAELCGIPSHIKKMRKTELRPEPSRVSRIMMDERVPIPGYVKLPPSTVGIGGPLVSPSSNCVALPLL